MLYAFNAEGCGVGLLIFWDSRYHECGCGRISWNSRKKMHEKRNRRWQENKWIYIFLWVGQNSWMKESLYSTRTTTDENIINILHDIKNQSEIQMQMSKLDRTSGRYGRRHVWNHVHRERKFVDGRFFEIIDIHRETKVRIDGLYETFIDDYWNITGDKSLSKPCIETTRFEVLDTTSSQGLLWVQPRLSRKQVSTRSANLAGRMVKHVEKLSV